MRSKNGKRIKKICLKCKRVFFVHPYYTDKKYCAKKCSVLGQTKGKYKKYECNVCTKRFESYSKRKYCSTKCKGIDIRGEKHPAYVGGGWISIRKIVLNERDFTCENCGFRDIDIMEVNHKLPKSKYPELARDKSNLEVLCPNCHRRKTLISIKNKWQL